MFNGNLGGVAGSTIICFPAAGASSAYFRQLSQTPLLGHVAFAGVEVAGRGPRWAEPPPQRLGDIAQEVVEDLVQRIPESSSLHLFGHSLGGMMAFETARQLAAFGRRLDGFVVAGCRPPVFWDGNQRLDDSAEALESLLAEYVNDEDMDPDSSAFLLNALRVDVALSDNYAADQSFKMTCQLSALAADADQTVPPSHVALWQDQAARSFQFHEVPGEHFFVRDQPETIAHLLARHLETAGTIGAGSRDT